MYHDGEPTTLQAGDCVRYEYATRLLVFTRNQRPIEWGSPNGDNKQMIGRMSLLDAARLLQVIAATHGLGLRPVEGRRDTSITIWRLFV